ncbi:MAG TPA: dihydrolipoyl dehydrogenase [Thermodesulfobacteriota bacterium]|nr:dihydrolipoyl dehydrogenase [Thermodesulfobacteriota bacterium]
MEKLKVDVAVIGAGTSGLNAYRSARSYTERVVLIEGGPYGTTCARVGCMPSKLMIAAADVAHTIEKAPAFGIYPKDKSQIDGVQVMKRIREERDRFVGFVLEAIEGIDPSHRLSGYARFLDDYTLQVGDHTLIEAKAVVIATGSSPSVPPMFEGLGDRLLISDDIFYWQNLPHSVAIFGAGIIGLEIGQALHRLGVKVIVMGKGDSVGPISDPGIREYAAKTFGEEFYFDPDARVLEVRRDGNNVVVRFRSVNGEERKEKYDYVLAATGRTPNVKNLGLEKTSLELDEKGVPLFDRYTLRCGNSSIFIAGDANNDLLLLHEASDEGKIAGENAARFPDIHAGHRRTHLSIVFTDPQIAIAGSRYKELNEGCFVMGEVSFEDQGRSRVMLKNKGLLHVYAEYGTGLFLGAEMFGPSAEHIGHLMALGLHQKMTVSEMLEMTFYHPVVEEGLRTALRDANNKLHKGPPLTSHNIDCGPGA